METKMEHAFAGKNARQGHERFFSQTKTENTGPKSCQVAGVPVRYPDNDTLIISLFGLKDASSGYTLAIAVILWFTVLFANFAEAIAGGQRQGAGGCPTRLQKDVEAHKIPPAGKRDAVTNVSSATLKKGDVVIVRAGEQIPADGEVIEGAASVDESAITGESAQLSARQAATAAPSPEETTVLSD